ncbi:matrin-3-like isoform X1 [Salvelinus namaycush]|uniref:Matrin-3-like isoform X1 n=1 Tax=Salvelinus namaycush TaxID=8040 RepID=A0A8U0QVF4_SALNM|nr:matrin-3-like isoform X1 [Salvelinus namaycush]
MSHNYSYRRPPPAKDLRASAFDSPDHLHPGDHGHNVYRSSQEPPSHSTIPSYPSSSSRASAANESPYSFSLRQSDPYSSLSRSDPYSSSLSRSDQILSLLSSCGLEPKDLSLLAEMPEELITVENLPRLLLEIRKKRATQQPPYPAMISYPPAATSRPPTATPPPGRAWEQGDQSRSQPLDYPLDPHHALPPSQLLPTEQAEPWQLDRHGNPMQYTRSRLEPVPVRVVDYHYGKETPRSYQTPRSTYSTAQGGSSNSWKPPNSSQPAVDYRYPPPPATNYRPRPDQDVPVVTIKMATSGNTPTKKAALDFHGEIPQTFPYSCSLCDITVLSEKFWFTHINGTQHADGQLTLLQMYPEWDCQMQTARSGDDHTDRPRVEEKTGGPSHRSINYLGKPSSSGSRKNVDTKTKVTKGSGKVVCAKFTARCLNEDGLKDLIKPFGEVVKVIMFHALAFVELGSTDQAADIVTYYLSNPVMVKGGQVTFSVSSTFNFLQSSRVLSFSPVPPGKESAAWKRELLAVAEGFGPVAHSLFLPTQAFVEMTNALDAQKLVGHHTSKHLKIDEIHIKVAFSSEYDTFRTMSERKSSDRKSPDRSRKSEDRSKRKRTPSPRRRSLSPRRDSPTSSKRRRSRERDSDRHKERVKSNSGGKSRPKSPRKQSSSRSSRSPRRPRSPSKQSSSRSSRSPRRPRSPSKQSSSRSSRSPHSHTKERVSSEKVSPISTSTRSQPPIKNKTTSQSSTVMEKSKKAVDTIDQSKQETEIQDSQEDGAMEACEMDSDIEGMAVYGEDGEENSDMGEEGEVEEEEEPQESAEDLIQEFKELCEPRQKATSGTVDDAPTEELSATGSEQGKELSVTGSEQGKELSATGSEQGKELSATGSEQGKELSVTGSEQGKELSATGSEQGKELSATGSEQGKEIDVEDQKGDTSYIDDEPDFPEDLENLITLDELEEDSSGDNQDNQSTDEIKSRSKSKPSGRDQTPGRVIYVKNLPRSFYTDSDFLKIVKGFGRVHRYLLLRNGEEGFIEMERSSDATKALRELRYNGCKLYGQKLIILRSQKYKRLTTGWKPESDSKSDRKKDHLSTRSSSRIRSGRTSSHSKSVAKDDKTKEKDDKTKEKDDKTMEKDDKTMEKDEETMEKDGETMEKDEETMEKDEETMEKDEETMEKDEETMEKDEETMEKDGETMEKDEETMEKDEETMEKDEETMEKDEETMEKDEETKEKTSRQVRSKPAQHCDKEDIGASEGNIDKSSNSEDQKDAPVPAAEKEKQACSNEDNAETKMEDNVETGPDSMKTGMESSFQANNPVGREFIKPVMGYFCDLCQVIYVNEDEAKNQHCSSLCHYLKFMEHSGKDTASS